MALTVCFYLIGNHHLYTIETAEPVSKSLLRKRKRNESERNRILEAAGKRAEEKDPKLET